MIEDFRSWLEARTALAGREADRFVVWAELQSLVEVAGGDGGNAGGVQ